MQTWVRETLGKRRSKQQQNQPLEEKESYCWLRGYEAANAVAVEAPASVVVSIADRAGDIYELLERMPSETNKAYWLIRSQHNRCVLNEYGKKSELKLWDTVRATKPIGEVEFDLPKGNTYTRRIHSKERRRERRVKQEIRTSTIVINASRPRGESVKPVIINVVHCREIDAPCEEERIEWLLLTSYPIESTESALEIVNWYLCRWQIEIFFKILKSGCTVEELQFDTLKATTNCVAIYLIVAWRILYLTMLGRHCPDMACSDVFDENEWRSVYSIVTKKPSPKKPPTLNEILLMIAKLGGFLGRKSDGYPGPKVMWIGMQRMRDFTLSWEIFRSLEDKSYV